jgi:hypothetical protein
VSILQCKSFEGYLEVVADKFNTWAKRNNISPFQIHEIKTTTRQYADTFCMIVFYCAEIEENITHNINIKSLD